VTGLSASSTYTCQPQSGGLVTRARALRMGCRAWCTQKKPAFCARSDGIFWNV